MDKASGDSEATREVVREVAQRVAGLVRSIPRPEAPVPRLMWSVGETAAHLVGVLRASTGYVTGSRDARADFASTPPEAGPTERTRIMNARYLDEVRERNPALLGDMLEEAATDFLAAVARLPADRLFLFPEVGVEVTPEAALSIEAGELLVHGFDIAKAVGRRWEIAASEAVLVIDGVMHLMPDYLDRGAASGVRASYELRIRGGRRYVVTIEDGVMSVGPPGKQVDCWISADPVTLLLVSYGRIGQWGPAFRGKILAGGRRPWLALRFKRYLTKI